MQVTSGKKWEIRNEKCWENSRENSRCTLHSAAQRCTALHYRITIRWLSLTFLSLNQRDWFNLVHMLEHCWSTEALCRSGITLSSIQLYNALEKQVSDFCTHWSDGQHLLVIWFKHVHIARQGWTWSSSTTEKIAGMEIICMTVQDICSFRAVTHTHTNTHKKAEQLKTNLTFGKFLVFWFKLWRLSIQQQRGLLLSDAQTLWRFFMESDLEHRWMDMDFIWIHRMHQKHTVCQTEKVVRKRMLKRGVLGSGTALAKTRTEW